MDADGFFAVTKRKKKGKTPRRHGGPCEKLHTIFKDVEREENGQLIDVIIGKEVQSIVQMSAMSIVMKFNNKVFLAFSCHSPDPYNEKS